MHSKDHIEVKAAQERGLKLTSFPALLDELFLERQAPRSSSPARTARRRRLVAGVVRPHRRRPRSVASSSAACRSTSAAAGGSARATVRRRRRRVRHRVLRQGIEVPALPAEDRDPDERRARSRRHLRVARRGQGRVQEVRRAHPAADGRPVRRRAPTRRTRSTSRRTRTARSRPTSSSTASIGPDGAGTTGSGRADIAWWARNLEVGKSGTRRVRRLSQRRAVRRFDTLLPRPPQPRQLRSPSIARRARAGPHGRGHRARHAPLRRRAPPPGAARRRAAASPSSTTSRTIRPRCARRLRALRKRYPKRPAHRHLRAALGDVAAQDVPERVRRRLRRRRRDHRRQPSAIRRRSPATIASTPSGSRRSARQGHRRAYVPDVDHDRRAARRERGAGRHRRRHVVGQLRRHPRQAARRDSATRCVPAQREDMAGVRALLAARRARRTSRRATSSSARSSCCATSSGVVGCVVARAVRRASRAARARGRPRVPRRGLRLDARRHGGRPGAQARRAAAIYLLTESASDFFAEKFGFRVVDRSTLVEAGRELRDVHARTSARTASRCGSICTWPTRESSDLLETARVARSPRRDAARRCARPRDISREGHPRDLVTEWDLRSEDHPHVVAERAPGIPIPAKKAAEEGPAGSAAASGCAGSSIRSTAPSTSRTGCRFWSVVDRARGRARGRSSASSSRPRSAGGSKRRAAAAPATATGRPLAVSTPATLEHALLATGFPVRPRDEPPTTTSPSGSTSSARQGACRRLGAASLDLCLVARGWMDGYWERKLKPWDVAAGALIVAEAGGHRDERDGRSVRPARGRSCRDEWCYSWGADRGADSRSRS